MKTTFPPDAPYDTDDDLPSSRELKANAEALHELGAQIVALPDKLLQRIPLEGALQDAVTEARRVTDREAKRRVLQRVSRLMRSVDSEPLRRAMEQLKFADPAVSEASRQASQWVERLLSEGHAAVEEFLLVAPQAERQRLSQLARQVAKDKKSQKPSKASHDLLSYVQEQLQAGSVTSVTSDRGE